MNHRLALIALTVLTGGCAGLDQSGYAAGVLTPPQAVMAAANAAPAGVPGTFWLIVRGAGTQGGRFYLNSEADYRDQRNLTIDIDPQAARALEVRYGDNPLRFFAGKPIVVRGSARRVKIYFLSDGRPTDKYYYQTHVGVTYPDQIRLAPNSSR
jgi:hypothetical protein